VCDFDIELQTHSWERFDELLDLSYEVLYRDFGVPRDGDWYHPANGSSFAIALGSGGALLGTARLLPAPQDHTRQVRQVAVGHDAHGRGVGRALMNELERLAAAEGAEEIWLHARDTAFGFYGRLGYVPEGELFVSKLTGIPHRTMRKQLGSGRFSGARGSVRVP
jgi:predicted GNAT family N-acyltransferase